MSRLGALTGIGAGALLVYYMDSNSGGKRRARVRDGLKHLSHQTQDFALATVHDVAHRGHGLFSTSKRMLGRKQKVPDEVLVARVRSRIGRYCSHPHAIEVSARDGNVTLRGLVLAHELDSILAQVARVSDVKNVQNELESHKQHDNIPSLQGGVPRPGARFDVLQENWAPATRMLAGAGGMLLAATGFQRSNIFGTLVAVGGAVLAARAITNVDLRHLFGVGVGRNAVTVQKKINIAAPVANVYAHWLDFEKYPRFMSHVRSVRMSRSGEILHWVVDGPAGVPLTWDARITRNVPNSMIAWRSEPGAIIQNAGRIQFRENEKGQTRIDLDFSYKPPGGYLAHLAAKIFGADPKSRLEEGLSQMKTLIERGPSRRQIRGLHV